MGGAKRDTGRWHELIAAHERSGLSLKAFAARAGVSVNTLAYWKYKRGVRRTPLEQAPRLVPVHVVDDEPALGELVVEIGSVRVRVASTSDLTLLRRVVAALRPSC